MEDDSTTPDTRRAAGLPRDFNWLWAGQAISEWGTQLTVLALPTIAITALSATTFHVGLLMTMENLATPLIGLFVGVYVDRVRRRPVLIAADIGRMLVLGAVVALWFSHTLGLVHLYLAAGLIGVFTVFFTVGYHAYVPSLVGRDQLMRANTRLEITSSGALLVGPASAGLLIGAVGSAATIAIDAVSFGLGAAGTALIRKPEAARPRDHAPGSVRRDIREGMRYAWSTPVLRALTVANALGNLGFSMVLAILTVFAYRILGLSPAGLGILLTVASTGFLVSAVLAGWAADRFGAGRSLVIANTIFAAGLLLTPLAIWGYPVAVLLVAQLLVNISLPWYNITSHSMQQAWTPDEILGRVNATMRTVIWGATPVGAFLGGLLGEAIGVPWTMAVGGAVAATSNLALLVSHIRTIREIAPDSPLSTPDEASTGRPG